MLLSISVCNHTWLIVHKHSLAQILGESLRRKENDAFLEELSSVTDLMSDGVNKDVSSLFDVEDIIWYVKFLTSTGNVSLTLILPLNFNVAEFAYSGESPSSGCIVNSAIQPAISSSQVGAHPTQQVASQLFAQTSRSRYIFSLPYFIYALLMLALPMCRTSLFAISLPTMFSCSQMLPSHFHSYTGICEMYKTAY